MTSGTTICCSAAVLFALLTVPTGPRASTDRPIAPLSLVPARAVWTLALNSPLAAPPAYDATRVFFALDRNRLVAYEILSGKQLWIADAAPLFQPASGDGLVFVAQADAIVALRAEDGSLAWRLPLAEPLAVRLIWDYGWLIGVARTGGVKAFRAADGHLVWQRDLPAPPHAPPAVGLDRVYVPLADGRIVALGLADGAVVWERRIGGLPNDVLALSERIYAGSTDNFFYCLLAADGKIDWRWRTGADVVGAAVADDRRAYFVSLDNILRGMNLVSGAQEWMRALPLRPTSGPVLAGATLVVSGQSSSVRTFNVRDGAPALEIPAGDEVAAPPHALTSPGTSLPMLLITTRSLARGAAARLIVRSMEPDVTPVIPLPNPFKPAPTEATR